MRRLIPAILTIAVTFLIPASALAGEAEAEALLATVDCVGADDYPQTAFDCHAGALEELSYLSPDVPAGCAALWELLYTFHAIGIAGATYPYDATTLSPYNTLPDTVELAVGSCLAGG